MSGEIFHTDPAHLCSTAGWTDDFLYPNLISSDSSLRKSTLRILSTLATAKPSSSTDGGADNVWSLCLQVENSEMTLRNVRERTNQISRLSRSLAALPKSTDSAIIEHAISFLLSQLKVNFRPLYVETIKALGEFGTVHGEALWSGVWTELEKISTAESATLVDIGSKRPSWTEKSASPREDLKEEEEAEYRCPNADKNIASVNESWSLSTDVFALDSAEASASFPFPA